MTTYDTKGKVDFPGRNNLLEMQDAVDAAAERAAGNSYSTAEQPGFTLTSEKW
jgi:hypothetical protein